MRRRRKIEVQFDERINYLVELLIKQHTDGVATSIEVTPETPKP